MRLRLNRWYRGDCTLGILSTPNLTFQCFTLELPWKQNKRNISCIPEGLYTCAKAVSPKNGDVFNVHNVQGRDYIQIHAGNYTRQTEGCILVGDCIKFIDGDTTPDVGNSRRTLESLFNLDDNLEIEIYGQ